MSGWVGEGGKEGGSEWVREGRKEGVSEWVSNNSNVVVVCVPGATCSCWLHFCTTTSSRTDTSHRETPTSSELLSSPLLSLSPSSPPFSLSLPSPLLSLPPLPPSQRNLCQALCHMLLWCPSSLSLPSPLFSLPPSPFLPGPVSQSCGLQWSS